MTGVFSLKWRIAASIVALEATIMAVVLWPTLAFTVKAAYQRQAEHERAILDPLYEMGRVALVTSDFTDLQAYVRKVTHRNDVEHVVMADAGGIVVVSTNVAEIGKPLPVLTSGDGHYWRRERVGNSNLLFGTLAIEFSDASLVAAAQAAARLGITIAVLGTALIAAFGIGVAFLLTRRLDRLTSAAERLADGGLDIRARIGGRDEVAKVGTAFDRMADRIQGQMNDLQAAQERFALAVSGTNDGIWDWDLVTQSAYLSPRARAMLGYDETAENGSIDACVGRVHPLDRERVQAALASFLHGDRDLFASEHRMRTASGEYVWMLVRGKVKRDAQGRPVRMAGSLTDISEQRRQQASMEYLALHDALTGLANRTLFHDRLGQALRAGARDHRSLSVLMIDIDRFKDINDTLGHAIGDEVLRDVALRLTRAMRDSDTVARFGGDEFMVLAPNMSSTDVSVVIKKIIDAFELPVTVEGHQLRVQVTVGAVVFPEDGRDPDVLLRRADVALYAAKSAGVRYASYDARKDRNDPERLALIGALRRAIDEDELVLHYQPKVDLRTGRVVGAEALVRWQHPTLGLLYPDRFISLAESCGLIAPLTYRVLDAALRQQKAWRMAGLDVAVAVNLSVRSLQDDELVDRVARMLNEQRVPAHKLDLEITESVIMSEPERVALILQRLDAMGLGLSIDDFGTGYSSLAYLQKLPVDEIKIDKSFVIDMAQGEGDAVIVRSIIDLGHNLGLRVVAEGVESEALWQRLADLGCDVAQGYHLSRPLAPEAFFEWARAWRGPTHPARAEEGYSTNK